MIKCNNCDKDYVDNEKRCSNCGTPNKKIATLINIKVVTGAISFIVVWFLFAQEYFFMNIFFYCGMVSFCSRIFLYEHPGALVCCIIIFITGILRIITKEKNSKAITIAITIFYWLAAAIAMGAPRSGTIIFIQNFAFDFGLINLSTIFLKNISDKKKQYILVISIVAICIIFFCISK